MLQQTVDTLSSLSIRKIQGDVETTSNARTDHVLYRTLLAYPEGTTDNPDFTRIPVFERLCALLNESMPLIPPFPVSPQNNVVVAIHWHR